MKPLDPDSLKTLKQLVTLEEAAEREEIERDLTSRSPVERELRGKALLHLVLVEQHYSPAEHVLLTFRREGQKRLPLFSLEVGDLVVLFPEKLRDVPYPTGTVYERTATTLTVAFSGPVPEWVAEERLLQLHRSINRMTYQSMYEALDTVLGAQGDRLALLRDVSLGVRKPSTEEIAVREIAWQDEGLNDSQRRAVAKAISANEVALVHGPPGTGKTTVLIEIIRQHLLRGQSVFATAPSNTACDNLLEKLAACGVNAVRLGHPARITTSLREHTLDFKLALHPLKDTMSDARQELDDLIKKQERYRQRRSPGRLAEEQLRAQIGTLKQQLRELKREIFARVMREAEVFVGTPVSIQHKALRETTFDVLVLDEAGQATEPLSWVPILRANKVIMAGDHCQLPPTIRSKDAEAKGLGVSLFERLYERLGDPYKTLLERQYRMHEQIMGFSSQMFYDNQLIADESVREHTLADLPGVARNADTTRALLFIDTAGKGFEEQLEEGSQSRYNPEEAQLVLEELRRLLAAGVPPGQIAVISPYSAQVRWLASRSPHPEVEIDSVDGFQGREKELVIVSLVRSNLEGELGFLADTRRMNVAMTRARRKLLVVGDSATLATIDFYQRFIKYAEQVGAYLSAWERSEH